VEEVGRFEREFHAFVRSNYPQIPQAIAETSRLEDDVRQQLEAAIAEFKKTFVAGDEEPQQTEQEQTAEPVAETST